MFRIEIFYLTTRKTSIVITCLDPLRILWTTRCFADYRPPRLLLPLGLSVGVQSQYPSGGVHRCVPGCESSQDENPKHETSEVEL